MNILDDCIKNSHLYRGCSLCFGRGQIGGDTNHLVTCPRCKGKGIYDVKCPECHGKGVVKTSVSSKGSGETVEALCDWCGGSGRDREVR